MQLSEKSKIFCCIFLAFLECRLNFEHFGKKMHLKGFVSENPSAVNVLKKKKQKLKKTTSKYAKKEWTKNH